MNDEQRETIYNLTNGKVRFDHSMAKHTTFQTGGNAEAYYESQTLEDLVRVLRFVKKEGIPFFIMGRGSNLLIKDDGVNALIILLRGALATVHEEDSSATNLSAGAGLSISELLFHCKETGLGGLEFLAGIPGTVGGAVAMNAGAFGSEMESRVINIQIITHQEDITMLHRSQLQFAYRRMEMKEGSVIVRVNLRVKPESPEVISSRISEGILEKKKSQPLGFPSAGCVFKNPPNDYAGRLLERAGLKGKKIGGAMISEKHANYIINIGGATTSDILELMDLAKRKVSKETGIVLRPEIQVLGIRKRDGSR